MKKNIATSSEMSITQASPECRMAALGLILRCVDRNKSSFSNSYITAPDGTVIEFHQAFDMCVSMIGTLAGY